MRAHSPARKCRVPRHLPGIDADNDGRHTGNPPARRSSVCMNTSSTKHSSPFDRFRQDHVRVLARLTEMASAVRPERPIDEAVLRRHMAALRRQFDTHMAAEEAIFYPLLARVLPASQASLQPLNEEHAD